MKRRLIVIYLLLFCFIFCSCGETNSDVSEAFQRQGSVSFRLTCEATFDATIGNAEYAGLTQQTVLEGNADLDLELCHLWGELTSAAPEGATTSAQIECYGGETSYYRRDTHYFSEPEQTPYYSIVCAPISLNLSEYEMSETTRLINGAPCYLYRGSEIVLDEIGQTISGQSGGSVSLGGCLADVELWVYEDASLPAQMDISYTNLAELECSVTDADGNLFTLTGLRYTVSYESYGVAADLEVPEEFLQESSENNETVHHNQVPSDLAEHGVIDFSGDPDVDLSSAYAILNQDKSYCYIIDTPEYMDLEEYDSDYICFYFLFDDEDIEYISYNFISHFTDENATEYALELPSYIEKEPDCSDVFDTGLDSIEINGQNIRYNVIYYTMVSDGVTYDCMEIYSWLPAPNGRDCLEVGIVEYNGTGDEIFIDVLDELIYAYEAILGGGNLE